MNRKEQDRHHKAFMTSDRKHILMITNHGIHQWQVVPGLPDTGGQNVFVNEFTKTLAEFGFRITIVNRGGYRHPLSDELHSGVDYKNANQRILYIEDDTHSFVRKEDMDEHTPQLSKFLGSFLEAEDTPVDLIISHYWDGAKIGALLNRSLPERVKHIWVPHSLGTVKKRNMPPEAWEGLRVDERIAEERSLLPELDAVAATSALIRQALEHDYDYHEILFLPPCVNVARYHPRRVGDDHPVWTFLGQHTELPAEVLRNSHIVAEISRTDRTKRKDVLIKAFARVHESHPDTLLAISIDDTEKELAAELHGLIDELDLAASTLVLGYVWEQLPDIYAVTDIYCSPSVMEGFGMSVQEAAATQVPVVGSHLIPFVTEYLLGENVDEVSPTGDGATPLKIGEGAIAVLADDIPGFAYALETLLDDRALHRQMGKRAYEITVPAFTWANLTRRFLEAIGIAQVALEAGQGNL